MMKARVLVRLKPGILDPQGATVQRALEGLGYEDIRSLRVGKIVELEVDEANAAQTRDRVEQMCRKLLANPITEEWTVEIVPEEKTS